MSWLDDFVGENGLQRPFRWAIGKLDKVDKIADKAADGASNLVDLLAGTGNILLYIGIGIAAVVILPIVLEKVL